MTTQRQRSIEMLRDHPEQFLAQLIKEGAVVIDRAGKYRIDYRLIRFIASLPPHAVTRIIPQPKRAAFLDAKFSLRPQNSDEHGPDIP